MMIEDLTNLGVDDAHAQELIEDIARWKESIEYPFKRAETRLAYMCDKLVKMSCLDVGLARSRAEYRRISRQRHSQARKLERLVDFCVGRYDTVLGKPTSPADLVGILGFWGNWYHNTWDISFHDYNIMYRVAVYGSQAYSDERRNYERLNFIGHQLPLPRIISHNNPVIGTPTKMWFIGFTREWTTFRIHIDILPYLFGWLGTPFSTLDSLFVEESVGQRAWKDVGKPSIMFKILEFLLLVSENGLLRNGSSG